MKLTEPDAVKLKKISESRGIEYGDNKRKQQIVEVLKRAAETGSGKKLD